MTGSDNPPDQRRDEDIVWRYVLERNARTDADATAFTFPFENDLRFTWAELDRAANQAAHAFTKLGLEKGDFIAVLSENTSQLVQTFFGAAKIGAILSPVNTAFRGEILRHILELSDARVIVCDLALAARLAALDPPLRGDPLVLTFGAGIDAPVGSVANSASFAEAVGEAPTDTPPDPRIHYWDPYAMICTSGTTGVSKGVLSPYGQIHASVRYGMLPRASRTDVFLVDAPLFHVGGMLSLETALLVCAQAVVCPRIHVKGYWDRIRRYGVTHATPMVLRFLLAEPPAPDDADNPLERILVSTWVEAIETFCARFDVGDAYGMFNMTEISGPLLQDPKAGSLGRPREGVEVRLVDDHDEEVGAGEVGELVLRTDLPWEMNSGYHKMPEETAAAWRNGWFHTGDLMRCDHEGDYFFVDRRKDSIRVRGENVSSVEVERETLAHPAVRECAAVSVASSDGEEAVKICVVAHAGEEIDPAELVEFLRERLPYFAVPRYIEDYDELPKTTSHENYGKVRKAELRAGGVTARTWDRVVAGVAVNRHS